MELIPLQNFVLLERIENIEEKTSELIIPEGFDKEEPNFGTILKVGSKVGVELDVGKRVLFKPYGFDEIKMKDKTYLIGKEENIIALLV